MTKQLWLLEKAENDIPFSRECLVSVNYGTDISKCSMTRCHVLDSLVDMKQDQLWEMDYPEYQSN